ncbi:MAG TPA: hypothetical protein VKR21_00410 [Solirubrobacteraceae bacterium]|nr:hypothetical protein [Solirubrobacteraceae bacterium]
MAEAYAKLERLIRWNILLLTGMVLVVGASNVVLTVLQGGPHSFLNAVRFGCMMVFGLLACSSAAAVYRLWRKQNAEIVDLYARLNEASEMLQTWNPFFDAINEAHRQGCAAIIQPADPEPPRQLH